MIIINIFGGLGNQMFQYSLGRTLSLNNKTELKFDLGFFKDQGAYIGRKFELENFNIVGEAATDVEINKFKIGKYKTLWQRLTKPYYKRAVVHEPHYHFAPEILTVKNNALLSGYWQSWKYFTGVDDIIRKDFTLKNLGSTNFQKLYAEASTANSVSLHFRRGDYLNRQISGTIGVQPLDYYDRALSVISKKITNPVLYIFSDDAKWVKENFNTEYESIYVSDFGLNDNEEMLLMSQCRNNIIANSSFSWWGGWLNPNPDKLVIAPQKWLNDTTISTGDLIPTNWIRL